MGSLMTGMNALFFVVAGLVLVLNVIYFLWSYFSLGRLVKILKQKEPEGNSLVEHLVHTRSSINLLYAMVTTGTLVLGFLGWNQVDKIKTDLTKEILEKTRVDLDTASQNVKDIQGIHSNVDTLYVQMKGFYEQAKRSQLSYDKSFHTHMARMDSLYGTINIKLRAPEWVVDLGRRISSQGDGFGNALSDIRKRLTALESKQPK